MLAGDIMTTHVITAAATMSVQEVARMMSEKGISAVPVVDKEHRVIGMVSECDLLHRRETGTERRRAWWLEMVGSTDPGRWRLYQIA
jgi:CBS-domain-containing membrane protein